MQSDFETLSQFLANFEPEVGGRSAEPITAELKTKLQAFARGELSSLERDEVVAFASTNDDALRIIAATAKEID